jgi:ubiquinone/menaquinone biosynthesis C-methylase UbiE
VPPINSPLLSRFLKTFFHLLYHQFAWAYDLVAWVVSAGSWQNWSLALLADIQTGRVLELGFGPGHLQVESKNKGIFSVGIDASSQMASIAYKEIVSSGFSSLLVIGYAQFLPFSDSSFDHLLASFPTNFILDPHTLSEAFRVLKPGGALSILPLARPTGQSIIPKALNWLFRITGQAPNRPTERLLDELHATYVQACTQAGFETHISYRKFDTSELWIIRATRPA